MFSCFEKLKITNQRTNFVCHSELDRLPSNFCILRSILR